MQHLKDDGIDSFEVSTPRILEHELEQTSEKCLAVSVSLVLALNEPFFQLLAVTFHKDVKALHDGQIAGCVCLVLL